MSKESPEIGSFLAGQKNGDLNQSNHKRPHSSIDMLDPNQAHQTEGTLKKHWHSYRDDAIKELQKAAV